VSWLTEDPPAGTSNRTVIEYETEGTAVTDPILSRLTRLAAPVEARLERLRRWQRLL
jgi:hypothetical protein